MASHMLGRKIPLKTARVGSWFLVQRQDGTIQATLMLDAYYNSQAAPLLPDSVDWFAKSMAAIARIYLNDTKGACVIASAFHELGLWTGNETGVPVEATDAEVAATYAIWNPGRQDNGCDIST